VSYAECECCGKTDYRDEIGFGCFDKETGEGIWCEKCYFKEERETCGKCQQEFCENHGDFDPNKECCGLVFCCIDKDDPQEDDCLTQHKTKRRACGHLTCNFSKGACLVCASDGEVQLAKDLKKSCKMPSLKKCLSEWLKETQAISKKAKKDQEKEKSLKNENHPVYWADHHIEHEPIIL